MQALLTVEQLSEYLQKSVASIRSYATRNPQSLPPICRLPGTNGFCGALLTLSNGWQSM